MNVVTTRIMSEKHVEYKHQTLLDTVNASYQWFDMMENIFIWVEKMAFFSVNSCILYL